ncbi:hypothetical protein BT96DRAFT_912884 [Gymnopus androsaceus JB14]|uniref:Uncharacterized protein n=1 Tax=Gymnopus androsaceus JB14 TaxID=1447944 RepID=A0A6A4INR1_9AGAR|nr:hypothetical protein BT96DRAFT_912884 [Gymnopus androsaceus JB14]
MPAQSTLTPEQELTAKAMAEKLFKYNRDIEEHATIFRQDPNKYAEAYVEYLKLNPNSASLPAPEDRDTCVADCEKTLAKPCENLLEHIHAYTSAMLLCRLLPQTLPHDVYMRAIELRTELEKANPLVVDPKALLGISVTGELHPLLVAELTKLNPAPVPREMEPDSVDYPPMMAVADSEMFSWDDFPSTAQNVTPEQIAAWKQDPEQTMNQFFVSDETGEKEAFKVVSVMTMKTETAFYLLNADEDEAYSWSSRHFFEMLSTAELRGTPEE